MSYGGAGPQGIKLPEDYGKRPPIRRPEQPPGRWTGMREKLVKWGGISVFVFLLVLFVVTAIQGVDKKLSEAEVASTTEALEATREARRP